MKDVTLFIKLCLAYGLFNTISLILLTLSLLMTVAILLWVVWLE